MAKDFLENEIKDDAPIEVNPKPSVNTPEIAGNINIGNNQVTVPPFHSIQKGIEALRSQGGGILYLQDGTYLPKENIIVYSNIEIRGVSPAASIIDFGSQSYNISFAGTNAYTTGTITSITSSVTVTGSGTSWLTNVTPGVSQFFINSQFYGIAAVTADTTLVLSEGYSGPTVSAGSSYRIVTPVVNTKFTNFAVKNSTSSAFDMDDSRFVVFNGVQTISNNIGIDATNCSEVNLVQCLSVTSTSDGFKFTNVGRLVIELSPSLSNGGHGYNLNNIRLGAISETSSVGNTSDGINITSSNDLPLTNIDAASNGGQGIECVSGNDNITMHGVTAESNTSDGIKLTATTDNCRIIAPQCNSNGGYGINIAASSCDNNIIIGPSYSNNTSGTLSDSGTSTFVIAPVGDITYTAGEDLTAGNAVYIEDSSGFDTTRIDTNAGTGTSGAVGRSSADANGDQERYAQSFQESTTYYIRKVKIQLSKNGSPSDNLVIALQGDSSGSPNGTDADTASIAGSSLTTSAAEYTLDFGANNTLTANTKYWIVVRRSGSLSDTDYYFVHGAGSGDPYSNGAAKRYVSSAWGTYASFVDADMILVETSEEGKLYKAEADVTGKYETFIGFVKSTVSRGNSATIQTSGEFTTSGLTAGVIYYISNTAGAIASSAGSNTRKVGIALSATKLLILNMI